MGALQDARTPPFKRTLCCRLLQLSDAVNVGDTRAVNYKRTLQLIFLLLNVPLVTGKSGVRPAIFPALSIRLQPRHGQSWPVQPGSFAYT